MGVYVLEEKLTFADVVNKLPAFVHHNIANCLFVHLLQLLLADFQRVDEDIWEASRKNTPQSQEVFNSSHDVFQEQVASDLDPQFVSSSNPKETPSFLNLLPALKPTYF